MNERIAIIDCGTNTFNLLIVEIESKDVFKKIFNARIPVKLGEGAINHGFIAQIPFNRGLSAIENFADEISKHHVSKTLSYATSAIRDAKNGIDFINLIKEKHQLEIKVIDGEKEAELIALGVNKALKNKNGFSLIIDIGGGSTEFIICDQGKAIWMQSFQIGAARLLDRFKPSDPITEGEVSLIFNFLKIKLESLFQVLPSFNCSELVGSSGAFDSLVEMIHEEFGGEALTENKTDYSISMQQYEKISKLIRLSNIESRRRIKGLLAMRVDMIVISCLIIDFIIQESNIKNLRVSTYSLKEGAVVDYLSNK